MEYKCKLRNFINYEDNNLLNSRRNSLCELEKKLIDNLKNEYVEKNYDENIDNKIPYYLKLFLTQQKLYNISEWKSLIASIIYNMNKGFDGIYKIFSYHDIPDEDLGTVCNIIKCYYDKFNNCVLKINKNENLNYEMLHEGLIGMYLNELINSIPNFVITLNVFNYDKGKFNSIDHPKKGTLGSYEFSKNVSNLFISENENENYQISKNILLEINDDDEYDYSDYFHNPNKEFVFDKYNVPIGIMLENLDNYQTLSEFVCNAKLEDMINIYLQILNALNVAYKKYKFTHNDLHDENILVKKLDNPIDINFYYNNKIKKLKTNYLVKIIDFGQSYMNVDGNNLGYLGLELFGIESLKPNAISDIYKLICFTGYTSITFGCDKEVFSFLSILYKVFEEDISFEERIKRFKYHMFLYGMHEEESIEVIPKISEKHKKIAEKIGDGFNFQLYDFPKSKENYYIVENFQHEELIQYIIEEYHDICNSMIL